MFIRAGERAADRGSHGEPPFMELVVQNVDDENDAGMAALGSDGSSLMQVMWTRAVLRGMDAGGMAVAGGELIQTKKHT